MLSSVVGSGHGGIGGHGGRRWSGKRWSGPPCRWASFYFHSSCVIHSKEFLSLSTDLNNALFTQELVAFFFHALPLSFSLLPGLHGFTGSGCLRLWHSLWIWYLQSENRQWLAGQVLSFFLLMFRYKSPAGSLFLYQKLIFLVIFCVWLRERSCSPECFFSLFNRVFLCLKCRQLLNTKCIAGFSN